MKKNINKRSILLWTVRNIIPMFLFPILNFYLFELYTHNPWETMKRPIQFLNIYFFELLMIIFLLVFGKLKSSLRLQSIFFMITGLANYYVIEFRSAPIMPWDIYSIGTAMSVADNFKYTVKKETVFVIIGFMLIIILESFVNLEIKKLEPFVADIISKNKKTKKNKKNLIHNEKLENIQRVFSHKNILIARITMLLLSLIMLSGFVNMLHQDSTITKYKMYDKLFTPTVMSKRDGTAVAFLMELKFLSIDKPDGYSDKKANEILSSYSLDEQVTDKKLPNIIVIMNEAFSDPKILGDFETNKDYMPFMHKMLNGEYPDSISGYLDVSVLGGNTANTEFEFLTGNTMAFLPQGSVAYQQYLKNELPSLPLHLKKLGYKTIAMHPYNSTGWERNRVYPILGFDDMYFIKDFKSPEKIRKYVSDQSCYDKIIELYENKSDDSPLFVFNVTMQNHSSYSEEFDNFNPDIEVSDSSSKTLNNYLSLMKISDASINDLINYFSNQEEETVIVFFGDHQPTDSVISNIWKLNNKSGSNLSQEDTNNRYKVPFFIWSNNSMNSASNVELSVNFLSSYLLDACGLPKDNYNNFLLDLYSKYPVVTSIRAQNSTNESNDIKDVKTELNNYAIIQYHNLFGKK